jgi:2-polyprenyl-3-methyl-5-hydroxy-6-metoxy-1,4-benzoquinol methylase
MRTEAVDVSAHPGLETLPYEPAAAFRLNPLQDDSVSADCQGKQIGILIVTYNAVGTLAKVLKRITPNVWKNVEEVLVFDDASADYTYELAFGMKTLLDLPKLTVLKHPKNLGYGGNQKAAYRYFIDRGFDIVVLLHGDGQYAPEILSHLYRPIVRGEADAVLGSRMMRKYGGPLKGGMPLYKFAGNRILTIFENAFLGMHLSEFHSGYRAYNLRALSQIDFSRMTDDFHFDTEIIIKLQHQHFSIAEVPIPTYYGNEICYVNGMTYARNVTRAIWRYRQCIRSAARYPEFEEYFVHYPLKRSEYSSHSFAIALAGSGNRVLDVGCGKGFLATELMRNGNRVTGIDALPAEEVLPSLERYFQADLEKGIGEAGTFDRVLLLDVLEHMKDPGRLLTECKAALKRNGLLVVSLPNIANITVRLKLLFGKFDYQERGIMDKTHLRWFTRRTARKLLEDHGYQIVEKRMTNMPVDLALGISPTSIVTRAIHRVLRVFTVLMPGLMGYQIMLVARAGGPTRYSDLSVPRSAS